MYIRIVAIEYLPIHLESYMYKILAKSPADPSSAAGLGPKHCPQASHGWFNFYGPGRQVSVGLGLRQGQLGFIEYRKVAGSAVSI